jgi:CMP-N-acetylneuraminate monooxygenase
MFVFLSKGIIEPPEGTKIYKDSWDFEPYLNTLNAAIGDEIFLHSSWIKEYFTWAGFKNYNLVVRVCCYKLFISAILFFGNR